MAGSVSVCVPAYNAARTIEVTLKSILDQDVDFEVVVLNNASTDATEEIVRSFGDPRVRVFENVALLPMGQNWNKVVSLASGELIKVVCADDILMPGSIALQAAVMNDPSIAIASAKFDVIDIHGSTLEHGQGIPGLEGRHSAKDLARVIVRRGPAEFGPTAAAVFRKVHFVKVGGFRGDLLFPMDVDLFARVAVFGDFFGMTEVTAAWRSSTFNMCSQTSTVSKLADMWRFHHRIAKDHPDLILRSDVLSGDARLVKTAFGRLGVRAKATLTGRPVPV